MAFPTTPVLDAFNRADGALGANWTSPVVTAEATPTISANVVIGPASVRGSAYWNVATYLDSEAYWTVPAGATGLSDLFMYARGGNFGTGTECNYGLFWQQSSATVFMRRRYNAANVLLNTVAGQSLAVGWQLGIRVQTIGGDYEVTAWVDPNIGTSSLIGTYTETGGVTSFPLLSVAGNIGLGLFGSGTTTRAVDDFGGGAVSLGGSNVWSPASWCH